MPRYSLGGGGGGTAAVTALNDATANELVTVGSTTTELDAETHLTFDGSDLKLLEAVNDGNPSISIGGADAERLVIQAKFDSGAQTLESVEFATAAASGTADRGKMVFDVDGTDIMTIDDGGVNIGTGSLETATIDYTDGDLSMTIADGGGVTFAANIITADIELGHATDTTIARSASGVVTIEGSVIKTAGTEDMWIPAAAMRPASTNGCATLTEVETTATRPDMQVLDFDSSTQEYAQFSVAMPKSWNEGTVTAQFYWTHATAVSTDVIWGIQGVGVSDNDTIDVAYGTAQTVTDTFHNAAEDLAVSAATSAITLAGTPAAGDLAFFQVYRDADAGGDTTNSTDARLIGVKINYTTNATNDA
jgi:hypothetical protein|tara:strand:- start:2556 stop:3647 length:1092 start_codon:yes stop_codon:yes gene_type:complete